MSRICVVILLTFVVLRAAIALVYFALVILLHGALFCVAIADAAAVTAVAMDSSTATHCYFLFCVHFCCYSSVTAIVAVAICYYNTNCYYDY